MLADEEQPLPRVPAASQRYLMRVFCGHEGQWGQGRVDPCTGMKTGKRNRLARADQTFGAHLLLPSSTQNSSPHTPDNFLFLMSCLFYKSFNQKVSLYIQLTTCSHNLRPMFHVPLSYLGTEQLSLPCHSVPFYPSHLGVSSASSFWL